MTWKNEIKKNEELRNAINRALGRTEKNPKEHLVLSLHQMADTIEAKYPEELFQHESSEEAVKMIEKGLRELMKANRLFNTRLAIEDK